MVCGFSKVSGVCRVFSGVWYALPYFVNVCLGRHHGFSGVSGVSRVFSGVWSVGLVRLVGFVEFLVGFDLWVFGWPLSRSC